MEKTTNLGLLKPAQEDFYNVDDFNANCDILDNAIKTNDDNAVHKSGDETIDGVKTFKKATILNSVVRDDTSHSLVLCGGTDGNNGAYLELVGKDVENANGVFSLHANNGTNNVALFGNAKGDLIWNGQNVIRSINGVQADTNGDASINFDDTYVKKSGDTMSGNLSFDTNHNIHANSDNGQLVFMGGSEWDKGAGITLWGKDKNGAFTIHSVDENGNMKTLCGWSNGSLTWLGQNIVRSVNGVNADTSGNVDVGSLSGATVVESYVNGTNGYRIWSDGFCEQWGSVSGTNVNSNSTNGTITLLKPYKDTNFNIVTTHAGGCDHMCVQSNSKSTFTYQIYDWHNPVTNASFHYRVCGFVNL